MEIVSDFLPSVLSQIVSDYAEDIFDHLDLMVHRLHSNVRILLHVERRAVHASHVVKTMLAARMSKKILNSGRISRVNKSILARSYLVSIYRLFKNNGFSSEGSCTKTFEFLKIVNKFYKDVNFTGVIFCYKRIKVSDNLIKDLAKNLYIKYFI